MMDKQHIIFIDDDSIQREAFRREMKKHPQIVAYIEEDVFSAVAKWILLTKLGHMPREVICDWHLNAVAEPSHNPFVDDSRDGKFKEGAHYLFYKCCKATDDGLLVCYTGDARSALKTLHNSIEGLRVKIVQKDAVTVPHLVEWVVHHNAYATETALEQA